jgi:branched-chain amino acid aminotransferase
MVNLNGLALAQLPAELERVQRGLYYGDALFESIRVFEGRAPLLEAHWARLERGLRALRYAVPADWGVAFWARQIQGMALRNARLRLSVWRSPGGLYAPEDNRPQFLITAKELEGSRFDWPDEGLSVGFCRSVRLPVDAFSGFKALNGPRYVAAAQEAAERGWDEGLLLNCHERVCEAVHSNVFWVAEGQVFTPPVSDGAVTGVLQNLLLGLLSASGHPVVQRPCQEEDLLRAEEIFLTNAVRGIRPVRRCEGVAYEARLSKHFNYLLAAEMHRRLH